MSNFSTDEIITRYGGSTFEVCGGFFAILLNPDQTFVALDVDALHKPVAHPSSIREGNLVLIIGDDFGAEI